MQNWGNIFTSMDVIGGKIFSNHSKNLNHVHKDSKDLLSDIITLGGGIRVGDTMFFYGVKTSDSGSRAHILKHLHGRMVFGTFEKCFHEFTLWRGHRALISSIFTKQIFLHFYRHGYWFYNQYINKIEK